MFTFPPVESASMSGVGAFVTSTDSIRLREVCSKTKPRPVLAESDDATRSPSIITAFCAGAMPRIEMPTTSDPTNTPVMPGRRWRKSPTLPLARLPKVSVATTFFTFGACRWSVTARALPSRSPSTVKASSR